MSARTQREQERKETLAHANADEREQLQVIQDRIGWILDEELDLRDESDAILARIRRRMKKKGLTK